MTAAAAAIAPDCPRLHMRASQKEGASRQAIRDCLIIASVIRRASVQSRSFRILDELQDEGSTGELLSVPPADSFLDPVSYEARRTGARIAISLSPGPWPSLGTVRCANTRTFN